MFTNRNVGNIVANLVKGFFVTLYVPLSDIKLHVTLSKVNAR